MFISGLNMLLYNKVPLSSSSSSFNCLGVLSCPHLWQTYKSLPPVTIGQL